MLNSFLYLQKDSEQDNGHSSDLDQRKSGILSVKIVHKVNGTKWRKRWWWHSQKADTQYSDPWVHYPEECSKAKVVENCRYTIVPDPATITTVFRTITSVNQLSLYGAVAEMCEEYESYHDRTERPVVGGQSSSSFVGKRDQDKRAFEQWWSCTHRISIAKIRRNELKSYHHKNRLSKFCTDAGFLTTVEVGQCFMTKDTEQFSQFTDSVACFEYTLPRDEDTSEPKSWIRGETPKLGPYWKLQPVAYKANMEWKSELSQWPKTILTHGSEFLMAWKSWSQTWTIRTKTTTSRKPQKYSSKNMR